MRNLLMQQLVHNNVKKDWPWVDSGLTSTYNVNSSFMGSGLSPGHSRFEAKMTCLSFLLVYLFRLSDRTQIISKYCKQQQRQVGKILVGIYFKFFIYNLRGQSCNGPLLYGVKELLYSSLLQSYVATNNILGVIMKIF